MSTPEERIARLEADMSNLEKRTNRIETAMTESVREIKDTVRKGTEAQHKRNGELHEKINGTNKSLGRIEQGMKSHFEEEEKHMRDKWKWLQYLVLPILVPIITALLLKWLGVIKLSGE